MGNDNLNTEGYVYNIQRYCVDDGPGIRTTVFLKGCPLKCIWCANPESQKLTPEVGYRASICKKCGKCIAACPQNAIRIENDQIKINRTICENCGDCVEACIPGAQGFYGKKMTVGEAYKQVERDLTYYITSNGGVTLSGGEPLMQADFSEALLRKCRNEGIHTCVETCGFASMDQLNKVLPFVSLFLYDLKHMDSKIHQQLTGSTNEPILRNLKIIADKGTALTIRIPLIPTCNDSEQNLNAMANFLSDLNTPISVEVMPYHNYGENKYEMLDRLYLLKDLEKPSEETLFKTEELFKSRGIECLVRQSNS